MNSDDDIFGVDNQVNQNVAINPMSEITYLVNNNPPNLITNEMHINSFRAYYNSYLGGNFIYIKDMYEQFFLNENNNHIALECLNGQNEFNRVKLDLEEKLGIKKEVIMVKKNTVELSNLKKVTKKIHKTR